mmetsp:Transcript_1631/g.4373  ORF Transcript_1631/g.4373 Transcript_1631/m.4373 type:complete len:220 (-) Transcript_1631:193-852(-)|eukprot:CAMPEP_0113566298 /NCGR_PEP_ID=MMETSP0015_2-20120614/22647_1 /TAXON_ID=2838 /ORGANISM="Odontella" /LENGTH=219 /DNA_ID=CAMNT_0000468575 /DNA_START=275 /DNA_END=937 /DNA_ORIENTATION=+ /assembly_acc=CAM_ASM_000160
MASSESVKVVLLGDSGVGKSSLVLRFITNEFKPYTESTIGASFMSKTVEIEESMDERMVDQLNRNKELQGPRSITFKIWDTAGQEKYHSLASMYYRGAAAAILVYDICNRGTFDVLCHWVEELQAKGPPGIVLCVCGNKYDLHTMRQIEECEAQAYADSVGAFYIETSARESTNVNQLFQEIGVRVPRPSGAELSRIEGSVQVDLGYVEENADIRVCGC